jgi:outer membrane autotransporter protein
MTRDPWLRNAAIHSYESDSTYVGSHIGISQKFEINDLTSVEGYGQFLWTRTSKDEFVTRFGDEVKIDSTDSMRGRVGGRLNRNFYDDKAKFYVGAAVENEFDAKLSGLYAQDEITNPGKLRGVSGIGELGLSLQPTESKNLSLDLDVFYLTGRQEGFGGNATLGFNF